MFGTTWYHKLPLPGVAEFVKRWQTAYPQSPIPVPGNVSYNGYMATRELLRAIERAGSTNNLAVIKAARRPQDAGGRPHAALRRLHRSGHPPGAADDLSRAPQRQAGGQDRPVRDPELDQAGAGARRRRARQVQAEADAEMPSYEL